MSDFKFGDLVRIKSGFYEGCIGILVDYSPPSGLYDIEIRRVDSNNENRKITIATYGYSLERVS